MPKLRATKIKGSTVTGEWDSETTGEKVEGPKIADE